MITRRGGLPSPEESPPGHVNYFSAVAMVLNLPDRVVPTVVTAVMITTEMRPAMRPYSMAVAPDSSLMGANFALRLSEYGQFIAQSSLTHVDAEKLYTDQ